MTPWLRRNRWGLMALPLAVALAVGANAQRVKAYWWETDLRHVLAEGSQAQWVTWSDAFTDATGEHTRDLRVKVAGVESAELALPAELVGRRVMLDFETAPNEVLLGCRLALLDGDGNRYDYLAKVSDVVQDSWPCLPEDRPGPAPSIVAGQQQPVAPGAGRPQRWSTRPVVIMPRDADVTQVLLWWEEPDYLAVQLD